MQRPLDVLPRRAGALGGLALLAVLVPSALSQTLIHRFDGPAAGDHAGRAVGGGGDVDGDGVADVIFGLPTHDGGAANAGAAWVVSGVTGETIHLLPGTQVGARKGLAVTIVDDLDGDGHAELLVGAPYFDTGGTDCGQAYLHDGATGAVMATFSGS
ncbi:MAG: FG-GAP repeat protein [Planctomycetota bacterium]|jgi:hypothetical protein